MSRVVVVDSEPAHEIDRVLVSADRWGVGTGEIDDELGGGTAPPPEHEHGSVLLAFHLDDDLFDQSPQELLAVLVGGARSGPHPAHIEREARDGCYFLWPENLWASDLTPDELGFGVTKSKERPLHSASSPPSNEAVVRVDGEIAPFGSARWKRCRSTSLRHCAKAASRSSSSACAAMSDASMPAGAMAARNAV